MEISDHLSCSQVFGRLDDLLRKLPMIRSTASLSRSELHRHWQDWRSECCRRRDASEFATMPPLQLLVQVNTSSLCEIGAPSESVRPHLLCRFYLVRKRHLKSKSKYWSRSDNGNPYLPPDTCGFELKGLSLLRL